MKKKTKKRVARSKTILDLDDLNILKILYDLKPGSFIFLDGLKEELLLSHKGLLIHLNRLISHDLIIIDRYVGEYKRKIVRLNNNGISLFEKLLLSPEIKKELLQQEASK